jgi:hypothetical protein
VHEADVLRVLRAGARSGPSLAEQLVAHERACRPAATRRVARERAAEARAVRAQALQARRRAEALLARCVTR